MANPNSISDKSFGKHSAFDDAFNTYVAGLQKKQKSKKLEFIHELQASDHKDGAEGIESSIQKLQTKCERQGVGTKTKNILVPIINAIKTYSSIVDVFVSAHPMPLALIWGSFRVFVELASIKLDLCEKLQEQMEDLKITIGRLTLYERYYYDYPGVQNALGRSYVSILEFWYQASKWCRERALRRYRKALKAPASTIKIEKALDQLSDDAERLEKITHSAEIEMTHEARTRQGNEVLEATKHRHHDYVFKGVALQGMLKDWLGGTHESNFRQYDHFRGKRHPGSCQWLLRHESFASWWAGRIQPSILWVQGQPGAGKSVLCSAAIEEAKKSPSDMAAAFLFLRLAQKAEPIQLLRNLSLQLLYQLLQRQRHDQDLPESLYAVLRTDRDDYANVKRMFEQLVEQLAPVYIFLDGLNEVAGDIQDLLKFLIGMASIYKLRLWCSSQYTLQVKRALEGCHELVVTAANTQDDIESYLSKTVPQLVTEGDSDFISKFQKIVLGDTKGCFLWASNMIEALASAVSEDERKLLVLDRLPRSMDQYYAGLVERLRKRDNSGWNLVRIVLSIVTFAKRSLRVSELREAIAILRGNLGDNLSSGGLPLKSKIIEYCSPLIECIDSSPDAENGLVQLSHSIVRDFLRKHSDLPQDVALTFNASLTSPKLESYVSSRMTAESCLRYLLQRKYSHLLKKKARSTFDVSSVYDLENHHLLLYAAEVWSHHYEEVEPTENDHTVLDMFLRSPNFYTLIQVQSLYLMGWTQRVSSQGSRPEARRILPIWFVDTRTGIAVESGYQEFIGEWGHLLRQGVLWTANGEIDRCFWGALGPNNCLSKAKEFERYPSFMFMEESGSNERCNVHYSHTVSPDGGQLMLAVLETAKQADEESTGTSTIRLERWDLDGSNGAFMEQKHELSQVALEVPTFHYSAPDTHRFALIPETFSKHRPVAIAISSDLHHMRVGASLLSNTSTEISTFFKSLETNTDQMIPYWEEIASRGSVVAFARRRAPRQESQYIGGRKILDFEDDTPGPKPIDDLDEDLDVISQDSGPMDAEVRSLFSESSRNSTRRQMEDFVSLSDKEDFPMEDGVDDFSDSDKSRASIYNLSFSDDDSNNDTPARPDPTAETSGIDSGSDSSNISQQDPFEYETEPHAYCNVCGTNLLVHYKCHLCTNYDVCESCFDTGKWCLDAQHLLTKKIYWGQQGGETVSCKDLALVQELMVLDIHLAEPRHLYRFSRKSEVLMFDSPPIFHPTAPLVVWLMSRDQLLFANFEADSERIHRIPSPRSKTQRIAASLQISPCGRYLHIISFETPVPKHGNRKNLQKASQKHEGGFQTSVHLMTYRLSDHDIQGTLRPPILSLRFSLGPLIQFSFVKLPFTVTWQSEEAYITVSDSELKVYKVSLLPHIRHDPGKMPLLRQRTVTLDDPDENDEKIQSENSYVSVLLQPLLLPLSAKDRSVQFFPPLSHDRPNVTLIIGPRSSSSTSAHSTSTPPLAIYLPATSFNDWTPLAAARKAEISSLTRIVQPLGGKFEDLGPGEELDLIRYRTLDGDLQSIAGLWDYDRESGGGIRFEIRYVEDLELAYGRERMLMRRVDIDGEEGDREGEEKEDGKGNEEERRVFKTSTGAGTAVLKAGAMEERAKMSWFCDLGPAEVIESENFDDA